MYPFTSVLNLIPTSTAESGPESGKAGTAVLGQIVQGHTAGGATTMLRFALAPCTGTLASVTFAVKLYVPAVVGVPEITPVALFSDTPVGNDPVEIDHV